MAVNNIPIYDLASDEEEFIDYVEEKTVSKFVLAHQYFKDKEDMELWTGFEVYEHWETFSTINKKMEIDLIVINCIAHYTPVGCTAMLSEMMADKFLNSKTMLKLFQEEYKKLSRESKNIAERLCLATTIDAHQRKLVKLQDFFKKRDEAIVIKDIIRKKVPLLGKAIDKVVIHEVSKSRAGTIKFYEGRYCEFCGEFYNNGSGLSKHLRSTHPKEFERSIFEWYQMACRLSEPTVQIALKNMRVEAVGYEDFEILLNPQLSKLLEVHIRRANQNSNNNLPASKKNKTESVPQHRDNSSGNSPTSVLHGTTSAFTQPSRPRLQVTSSPPAAPSSTMGTALYRSPVLPKATVAESFSRNVQERKKVATASVSVSSAVLYRSPILTTSVDRTTPPKPVNSIPKVLCNLADQYVYVASPQKSEQEIIAEQQKMIYNLLNDKQQQLQMNSLDWEKKKKEEELAIAKEKQSLQQKQKYWKAKEQWRSKKRHTMVNGKANQIEKMKLAVINNPSPHILRLGLDELFLDYLANNEEQKSYPYYWLDKNNNVHCHCYNNPLAVWMEDRGWLKCAKPTKGDGKCSLFLPVRDIKNNCFE